MPPATPRPPSNPSIVASSLTRGLAFAWVPTAGRVASSGGGLAVDLVTGQKATIPTSIVNVGGVWHGNSSTSAGSLFTVRPELKYTGSFTVVTYYRPHTSAPYGAICANRSSGPQQGWEMFYFNGICYFRAGDGASTMQFCVSKSMPTTSWLSHAVVVRASGAGRKVDGFMNGAYYGSTTLTTDISYGSPNDTFRLGSSNAGTPEAASCQIGAVYVFNRELTPAEIRALDADPYLPVRPDPDPAVAGLLFVTSESTFDGFSSSSRAGSIQTWSAPSVGDAKFSDGVRAEPGLGGSFGPYDDWTDYLIATDLTTPIPVDAVLLGIEIDVEAVSSGPADVPQIDAQLMLGGSPIGTLKTLTSSVGTTESVFTFGSPTDFWGATLTATDVNASDFGVRVSFRVDNTPDVGGSTVSVDQILVRPTYLSSVGGPTSHEGAASGGMAVSGSAAASIFKTGAGVGGLVVGGSAASLMSFVGSVLGGIVVGGGVNNGLTGSASGGAVISGTAAAELITYWVNGGLVVTGTGTANRSVSGSTIGAVTIGGVAAAVARLSPAASGGISVSGSGTGKRAVVGAAHAGLVVSGAVVPRLAIIGAATSGMSASGVVGGFVTRYGSASGACSFSGSVAGVNVTGGAAVGGILVSGTGNGKVTMRSGATGGIVVSGTPGASVNLPKGAAIGGIVVSHSVSPRLAFNVSVAGGMAVAGAATGMRFVRGAVVPNVFGVFDEGTEQWSYTYISNVVVINGSCGSLLRKGSSVRGGLAVSGSAAGVAPKLGSVLGGLAVSGSARGNRVALGAGVGTAIVTAAASGHVSKRGATIGGLTVFGAVSGAYRRNGQALGGAIFGGRVVFAEVPYDAPEAWQVDCTLQQQLVVEIYNEIEATLVEVDGSSIDQA